VQEELIYIADNENMVNVELFTRLNHYSTPVTRSADENGIEKTPWLLVFTSSDGTLVNATYTESAQAYVAINQKSYVELYTQTNKTWILILANPQDKFYANGSDYDFSTDNFDLVLTGKTLTDASLLLSAIPLTSGSEVTTAPFDGTKLPMSYLLELPDGISRSTTIGTEATPLEMVRAVAKIAVKNSASNFDLLGVHSLYNLNNNTVLHNYDGSLSTAATYVDYIANDPYLDNFVTATNQEAEPIYAYEALTDNDNSPFIIINANYDNKQYYYKLALVDDNESPIDLKRNHAYEFTITAANAPGFATYEDAILGNFANTPLVYNVLLVDASAHETIANREYYLSVSNRDCIIYNTAGDGTEYIAFTLTANSTYQFSPENNYIKVSGDAITITSPETSIPTASTSNDIVTLDVKIKVNSAGTSAIKLKLGDLEQTIMVYTNNIIPAGGTTLQYADYYLLSAELVETTPWVTFRNSYDNTNTSNSFQVEDGILYIDIAETSATRNAVFYLTTIKDPDNVEGDNQDTPRRIKTYVYQSGS